MVVLVPGSYIDLPNDNAPRPVDGHQGHFPADALWEFVMSPFLPGVHDLSGLRFRVGVFRDRRHAGEVLACMLDGELPRDAVVFAIPAGGVPVALEIATRLSLPMEAMVASKITLPSNTETGYGAVAFDGTLHVNRAHVAYFGLDSAAVASGTDAAQRQVMRRLRQIYGARGFPVVKERTAVLVDDGLASGATMHVAVAALRNRAVGAIIVAVPTAHDRTAAGLAAQVDDLYCANVRSGARFAVADAYQHWTDVPEEHAIELLCAFPHRLARAPTPLST
jgi:predicted phosphoribosyltransferase